MGKRKSATIRKPKAKEALTTTFDCPFCTHSKCVETKLERKRALGTLFCRVCSVNYAMKISNLTEPIDVYSEWIDRCEEENYGGGVENNQDYEKENIDEGIIPEINNDDNDDGKTFNEDDDDDDDNEGE